MTIPNRWSVTKDLRYGKSADGRRTFITSAARKASLVGGSLRDVMALAGHRSLSAASRYFEIDAEVQAKFVNMVRVWVRAANA